MFLNNPQVQKDFGYLQIHSVLEVIKQVVRRRYGADAERYYFEGCSNGGREALIQATRYPADFDGIVVRAPAYSFTELVLAFNSNMKHQRGTAGGALSAAKASTIASAAKPPATMPKRCRPTWKRRRLRPRTENREGRLSER